MTDCKRLLQQRLMTSVQNAIFTYSNSDRRRRNWTILVWHSSIWKSRSMEPITVTWFCHNSCCLPYVISLVSLYFRKHTQAYRSPHVFRHGSATVVWCDKTKLQSGARQSDTFSRFSTLRCIDTWSLWFILTRWKRMTTGRLTMLGVRLSSQVA